MDALERAADRQRMSSPSKREQQTWLRAFGQAIRELRTRTGLTQEQLGYRTGLDQTYVSGIERGRRNPGPGGLASGEGVEDIPGRSSADGREDPAGGLGVRGKR